MNSLPRWEAPAVSQCSLWQATHLTLDFLFFFCETDATSAGKGRRCELPEAEDLLQWTRHRVCAPVSGLTSSCSACSCCVTC